jgi:fucose permease
MDASNEDNQGMKEALFKLPFARVTWLCAAFLLCYVGVEVSIGGWIVQFMIRVRKAENYPAGMTSMGFWLGLSVGRAILGFVTPRLGVKVAVALYLPAAMALQLVFWLVPSFYVSAITVAFQGFFLGPLFPAVVVATTKMLPKHLHVSTIGFAAAFGGSGAAVLPFAVGAIAQAKGVKTLQPIILAFLTALLGLWLCLPRLGKKKD